MEKDTKNRFDEKRPFDVVRAEDFGEDLYEFYNPIEKLIRRVSGVEITGSRPVFLIGGRGTGKTMVLKYHDFNMQLKVFVSKQLGLATNTNRLTCEEMKQFLKQRSFIGIYCRFKTTEYDPMKGDIAPFFEPYLSIRIAERLFEILKCIKECDLLPRDKEKLIVTYFSSQVKEPRLTSLECIEDAIAAIEQIIIPLIETIEQKYAYYSIDEIKKSYQIPTILYSKIFFDLPDLIFQEVDCLRGKKLFILLDELEYLDDYKASCIGELIKGSDETVVIFKVGSRYMPDKLPVGRSSEVLQEPHDLRVIKITDALNAAHSGKKEDYSNLIKNILNKRLEKSELFRKRGLTRIEQLFPNLPLIVEAKDLVKGRKKHWDRFRDNLNTVASQKRIEQIIDLLSYPDNPIVEKLNMLLYYRSRSPEEINRLTKEFQKGKNKEYSTLYEKNALNLLFQLCNDYGQNKKYAGIDVFINLSSGIIRNAIEICNQALNTAYNYGYERQETNAVEVQHQDIGAKTQARLQYEDIQRVPGSHSRAIAYGTAEQVGNIGMEIQDFVSQLGNIFRNLHLDQYLVEPEQTHFETDYLSLDDYSRQVVDTAEKYSYLQQKYPMSPKDVHDTKRNDFVLNRVFAPYFQISYRTRGRTYISPKQIQSLISGDNTEKKSTRIEVIIRNTKKRRNLPKEGGMQKTLLDAKR